MWQTNKIRLLLAFTGGSSEIRATLAHMAESSSHSSGSNGSDQTPTSSQMPGLKPVAGLACSMKFAQFQARRLTVDVNEVLFFLMEEDRALREGDMRRLRERLVAPVESVPQDAVLAYERRTAELEEQLRFKEIECENLARQLREKTDLSGASVRRTAPLFSPGPSSIDRFVLLFWVFKISTHDDELTVLKLFRPNSPTPSVSSLTSQTSFSIVPPSPNNSASALRRRSSLGFEPGPNTKPDIQIMSWGQNTPSRQATPVSYASPSPLHVFPQGWPTSPLENAPRSIPRTTSAVFFNEGSLSPPPPLHRVQSETNVAAPLKFNRRAVSEEATSNGGNGGGGPSEPGKGSIL